MSESGLAPGWYPHQDTPQALRYWDGQKWTENLAPVAQPVAQSAKASDGLVVAGLITMIFIPIIGFVIGIIVAAKGRAGVGVLMLVVSLVASIYWLNEFSTPAGF